MYEFVENFDDYADKYSVDSESGEITLVDFSVFMSKDCSVQTFDDLTESG